MILLITDRIAQLENTLMNDPYIRGDESLQRSILTRLMELKELLNSAKKLNGRVIDPCPKCGCRGIQKC
jgi:hypothetical protein